MNSDEMPVSAQFLQMATAKLVTKPMYVAAKLKVADHIKNGITSIEALSEKTRTDSSALYRLLRALSSVGIFHETENKNFSLTPLAQCLLDEPDSPRGMLMFFNDPAHDRAWDQLLYSVKTGEAGFNKAAGKPIFDYLQEDEKFSDIFNTAMSSNAKAIHGLVAEILDTSSCGTIYDIGGGQGHLIQLLMDKNPDLKGGVFDLPHVVEGARQGSAHDIEIFGGSFFEGIPTGADAHIMSFIIHDWDDESSLAILRNCYDALPAGGKIFICDCVITEPNQPNFGALLDIEMLVMTTGKERTVAEFKALIEGAGFNFEGITPTPGPHSIITGRK